MKIKQWNIDKIKPYDKNPRRNDKAVEAVANSLREFGFRQPIVVDSADVIMVGTLSGSPWCVPGNGCRGGSPKDDSHDGLKKCAFRDRGCPLLRSYPPRHPQPFPVFLFSFPILLIFSQSA
ncbi:MAG: ParB N-terminal domain-containing protein [Planctomycetaceae bacterium]|nr:ParB N-terminal domain-containing protein [Planctomycetaceae bacterium]